MSLYQRGDVWWSRIMIKGQVYYRSTGLKNKKEARNFEGAWRTQILKGEVGLHKAPTMVEYSARFLNYLPPRVKHSTYVSYVKCWTRVMAFAPLANHRLDEIRPDHIEQFIQRMQEEKKAIATINVTLRCLRRAFTLAQEWGLIHKQPKFSALPNEHQRDFVICEADANKLIEAAPGIIKQIIPFAIDTGLRASELCKLTWADVECLDAPVAIHVRQGKTKHSRRRIPLTKRAASILSFIRSQSRQDVASVFTRSKGRGYAASWGYGGKHPFSVTFVSMAFLHARRKAGLPDDCVLHSTRHTFCTNLGAADASAFEIQKLAGHSSIEISARYCHPEDKQLEKAIARMG